MALALIAGVCGVIYAVKDKDPGAQDIFGDFRQRMLAEGKFKMENVECTPRKLIQTRARQHA